MIYDVFRETENGKMSKSSKPPYFHEFSLIFSNLKLFRYFSRQTEMDKFVLFSRFISFFKSEIFRHIPRKSIVSVTGFQLVSFWFCICFLVE